MPAQCGGGANDRIPRYDFPYPRNVPCLHILCQSPEWYCSPRQIVVMSPLKYLLKGRCRRRYNQQRIGMINTNTYNSYEAATKHDLQNVQGLSKSREYIVLTTDYAAGWLKSAMESVLCALAGRTNIYHNYFIFL